MKSEGLCENVPTSFMFVFLGSLLMTLPLFAPVTHSGPVTQDTVYSVRQLCYLGNEDLDILTLMKHPKADGQPGFGIEEPFLSVQRRIQSCIKRDQESCMHEVICSPPSWVQ